MDDEQFPVEPAVKGVEKMLPGKEKQTGFTMMELLTVLLIISVLAGVLIPSMNTVRKAAKNAKQKAQFAAIEIALLAFKTDNGDYPPSAYESDDYTGAQKLAEAMVGWDLMGFYPGSNWDSGGSAYDSDPNFENRHYYLELSKANVYRLGHIDSTKPGLFKDYGLLEKDTFVICDSFGVRKLTMGKKVVRAGTPILYYRANPSNKSIETDSGFDPRKDGTYYQGDNYNLVELGKLTSNGEYSEGHENYRNHELYPGANASFYFYIKDQMATDASGDDAGGIWRAYNPDSYILVSAGADGEYGTADDITNFGD